MHPVTAVDVWDQRSDGFSVHSASRHTNTQLLRRLQGRHCRRRPPPVTADVFPVPYGLFTFLCCSCRGPCARAEPIGSTVDVHICCSPPFLLCGLIPHELLRSNFTQFNTLLINLNHRQPCLFHQGESKCARNRSPGIENRDEMIFSS